MTILSLALPATAGIWDRLRPAPATASAAPAPAPAAVPAPAAQAATLTFDEFTALAVELAPKVDLFRDLWAMKPSAEFFGGTTRDYLYWLKGRLRHAKSASELASVLNELRSRKEIKLTEFIAPGSDVDVIMKRDVVFDGTPYGVKKVDAINLARFDVDHGIGQTEIWQGFIPIEKIRLSQTRVFTDVQFGDGVRELFESRLTVKFASEADFAKSHYAKLGINHPILLALRYIRAVSIDAQVRAGTSHVRLVDVLGRMDDASKRAVMSVVKRAANGIELRANLEHENKDKFIEWYESALKKASGKNTNQELTAQLFEYFGVDEIPRKYPELSRFGVPLPKGTCERIFRVSP